MATRSITETFLLSANNTDVLKAPSRLSTAPRGAILVLECSALNASATNNGKISVTTPEGDLLVSEQIIPANGMSTTESVLDERTKMTAIIPVPQGGHVLVAYGETGTTVAFIKATLIFND